MSSSWAALYAQMVRSTGRRSFQWQFAAICAPHKALCRFGDLAALVDHQQGPHPDPRARNAVLQALIHEAQRGVETSDAAVIVILLALWPGLDAVYRRLLRFYRETPDALAADIVAEIADGITRLDLGKVNRVAATLLMNLERNLKRRRIRDQRQADHDDIADHDMVDARDTTADAMLARDLRRLLGKDTEIVIAVALRGEEQREVAERLGLAYDALRKRYQRAMARLRAEYTK